MTRNPPPSIPFTPQVRERQSRGRDHYLDTSSEDEDYRNDDAPMAIGEAPKKEYTWEEKESKGFAMSVLDNPDRLMMHAHSLNDSLPSQRCRFWALLCGMRDDRPLVGQKPPPRRR